MTHHASVLALDCATSTIVSIRLLGHSGDRTTESSQSEKRARAPCARKGRSTQNLDQEHILCDLGDRENLVSYRTRSCQHTQPDCLKFAQCYTKAVFRKNPAHLLVLESKNPRPKIQESEIESIPRVRSRRCVWYTDSFIRDCIGTHAHSRLPDIWCSATRRLEARSLYRQAQGSQFTHMRSSFAHTRKNATARMHEDFAAEMPSTVPGAATRMQNNWRARLSSFWIFTMELLSSVKALSSLGLRSTKSLRGSSFLLRPTAVSARSTLEELSCMVAEFSPKDTSALPIDSPATHGPWPKARLDRTFDALILDCAAPSTCAHSSRSKIPVPKVFTPTATRRKSAPSLFSSSLLPKQTLQKKDTDGKCAHAVGALSCSPPFQPPAISGSPATLTPPPLPSLMPRYLLYLLSPMPFFIPSSLFLRCSEI